MGRGRNEAYRISKTDALFEEATRGRKYDLIRFRNGYGSKAPEMLVEFRGVRRYGKGRNGCYAIQLGRVLKIKRWKP
jgi:hypothetical protein